LLDGQGAIPARKGVLRNDKRVTLCWSRILVVEWQIVGEIRQDQALIGIAGDATCEGEQFVGKGKFLTQTPYGVAQVAVKGAYF
jgi:hypothetical protein